MMRVVASTATLAAGVLAAILLATACTEASQTEAEELYRQRCQVCHAADGSADTAAGKGTGARDFAHPEVWSMSDAEWIEITTEGRGKMPAFGKTLTPEQIEALVEYCRELVKERVAE